MVVRPAEGPRVPSQRSEEESCKKCVMSVSQMFYVKSNWFSSHASSEKEKNKS